MTQRSVQRIFVVQRKADDLFLHENKNRWTRDVSHAFIASKTKFKSLIRVDLGRDLDDYRMIEAVPQVKT